MSGDDDASASAESGNVASGSLSARAGRLLGDERVRYLVVGGFNTALCYGLFVAAEMSVGRVIGYLGSLYLSYTLAIVIAFSLHRRFTFRANGTGSVVVDFSRFTSVHIVALAVNTVALPVLVEFVGIPSVLAQAGIVAVTTVVSYFGHKLFSFRRTRQSSDIGDRAGVASATGVAEPAGAPEVAGPVGPVGPAEVAGPADAAGPAGHTDTSAERL